MYRPTIGLEIHAELKTKTKMFCSSKNDPDETRPNVNICPVCMAHPGTLPVINREAVRHVLRVGTAIGGTLADFTEFDRKSYFYPDIPKGYQISQYEHPLIVGGELAGVQITRIHLEEDTARSIHSSGKSLVDFNRAGIPLMELVTEPVIHDAETAGRFARELQLLLRTLGAGEANLEKGEMRIEANISVSSDENFGTKVEVKNINSFRSVERAITFEIDRQTKLIESGGKVSQETRGWDESRQETFHQRFKEGSADYRYFPEPDLPKLFLSEISEFSPETLRASLPELPWDKRSRMIKEYGMKEEAADLFMQNVELGTFFEKVVSGRTNDFAKLASNYITSDLLALMSARGGSSSGGKEKKKVFSDADSFIKLIELVVSHKLSSRGAKDTLAVMVENGGDPETIAREHNLMQVHDTVALGEAVDIVIATETKAVGEYKSGKLSALQYLVGKAMKESKGAGNPEALREIFLAKLNSKH